MVTKAPNGQASFFAPSSGGHPDFYPPNLYDGHPPAERPETSREAAEEIAPHVGPMHERIMSFLAEKGMATCDMVEAELDMRHQTASARMRELSLMGRIQQVTADGKALKLKTRSGRNAFAWERTRKGGDQT